MQTGIRVDTRLGTGSVPEALRAWKAGQILKAVVVGGTPAEAGGGRAVLNIGGQQYAVRSQTPLHQGEVLRLQVRRTQPEPVLQRVAENKVPAFPRTTASSATRAAVTLDQGIRTLLASQGSLAKGLQDLLTRLPQLSVPTARRLDTLLASLPTPQKLAEPSGLRAAVANAGNHLENALQLDKPPASADLKLQLTQTLAGLTGSEAPPVRRAVESMVARIGMNQLHSTQASGPGTHLVVDLPVRTAQGIHDLRIEIQADAQGGRSSHDTPPAWAVTLRLAPPGMGPLEARVTSISGSVSARFWAERSHTARRIEEALPDLAAAWSGHGLKPGVLQAYHGKAPAADEALPAGSRGLVDTRA